MIQENEILISPATAREVVLLFIQSLNDEDFTTARDQLHDDMTFTGVLGTREGADLYIEDMKKMRFKYDIKKAFADITDVSVFYDITMSGITVFCSGWYRVENGKISWFKVVFDPRPVLEQKK